QIYPEYVPKQLNKVAPARMDQLSEWLRAHSQVDWFDVRPALVAERANDRPGDYVYFPLGTHWEMRGAIATYNAIADHLHPVLPGPRRYSLEDFRTDLLPFGDTEARNMYIGDLIPQALHRYALRQWRHRVVSKQDRVITYEVADPSLPRVVIFHDSFGS